MEKNLNSRSAERIACEFCSEEVAVLYCRADFAKLCLLCDEIVHSANFLARKHTRSLICDNCSSEPVSFRCSTDNLLLCQECDRDVHGSSSAIAPHECNPVEGFSGLPSALEFATLWGFDFGGKKSLRDFLPPTDSSVTIDSLAKNSNPATVQDPLKTNETPPLNDNVSFREILALSKRQNPKCGKHKRAIFKQLRKLLKQALMRGDRTANDLVPGKPGRTPLQGDTNCSDLQIGRDGKMNINPSRQHQTKFTSSNIDLEENDDLSEEDILWDCDSNDQNGKIWGFRIGRSKDHEDPVPFKVGNITSEAGFMINSSGDFSKESPFGTNYLNGDISSQNDYSKNPVASESDNVPVLRSSSGSIMVETNTCSSTKDVPLLKQPLPLLLQYENEIALSTKADMELLAQKRSDAMLRYKEKKKNRRYDKHVRYESRKARAETRKRVSGRFVKIGEAQDVEISN